MLRFIVLGEIPGTQISLTFFQVLLVLGSFYGLILLRREHRLIHGSAPQENKDITI